MRLLYVATRANVYLQGKALQQEERMNEKDKEKSLDDLDDEVMTDLYTIQHSTEIICHSLIAGTDIEVHLKELDRDYENLKETIRRYWEKKERLRRGA